MNEFIDFKTNELHVQINDDDNVCIYYFLSGELHSMNRQREDTISKTLKRLEKTFNSKIKKTSKSKNNEKKIKLSSEEIEKIKDNLSITNDGINLLYNDIIIDSTKLINIEFKTGMIIQINNLDKLIVIVNPPTISSITSFPKSIISIGNPIIPSVENRFIPICSKSETNQINGGGGIDYMWCIEKNQQEYLPVCREKVYIPSLDALGCRVKLYCNPWVWTKVIDENNFNDTDLANDINEEKNHFYIHENIVLMLNLRCNDINSCFESKFGRKLYGRTATYYLSGIVTIPEIETEILLIRHQYNIIPRRKLLSNQVLTLDEGLLDLENQNELSNINQDLYSNNNFRGADELRVVTFNILAEPFATSDYAVNFMFKYCDKNHLETEYRSQMVAKELLSYNADIICLQECDKKVFDSYLNPLLNNDGFLGHYTNKSSRVLEGCATFTKGLRVLRRIDLPVKNILKNATYFENIFHERPDIRDIIGMKIGTIGQITLCQSESYPEQIFIICNTHLFYHPDAGYIRLLQVDVMIRVMTLIRNLINNNGLIFIDEIYGEVNFDLCEQSSMFSSALPTEKKIHVSSIFLGDLNSTPETAVIEYLRCRQILNDDEVWLTVNEFRWGSRQDEEIKTNTESKIISDEKVKVSKQDKEIKTNTESKIISDEKVKVSKLSIQLPELKKLQSFPDLVHDIPFISAAGFPEFTNYTGDFKDLLDYIFIEIDSFGLIRYAPFPIEDTLAKHTALPSKNFPSDHISVCVDLKLLKIL